VEIHSPRTPFSVSEVKREPSKILLNFRDLMIIMYVVSASALYKFAFILNDQKDSLRFVLG
jgi:hypothetical protein